MRVLILGFGSIGRRHGEVLGHLGSEVAYLRSGKGKLSNLYPAGINQYSSFDYACAHFQPDYIVDASPSIFHLDNFFKAISNGIPILIEKPFFTTSPLPSQIDCIINSLQSGFKAGVCFQYRYHPVLIYIKELLKDNAIKPIDLKVEWHEFLPSWHPWEDYRLSYASNKHLGGGCLLTMCHPFDYIEFIFGDYSINSIILRPGLLDIDTDQSVSATLSNPILRNCSLSVAYDDQTHVHQLKITSPFLLSADLQTGIVYTDYKKSEMTYYYFPFQRNDLFSALHLDFQSYLSDATSCNCLLDSHIALSSCLARYAMVSNNDH